MIRTSNLSGPPRRRIAVIEMPRPQRARLGIIRPGNPAQGSAVSWVPTADEPPESSANFLSTVVTNQNNAVTSTPGTLSYTPANNTPAPAVAPWNSWLQPNCGPGNTNDATPGTPSAQTSTSPATPPGRSPFLILLGVIGGLASAKYLLSDGRR